MQKLAILGGTFNPLHWGHLLMAEAALDQMALDQVIWVPDRQSPHRSPADIVPIEHRMEMVRQAIAPHPAFAVSPMGLERSGSPFAIDTFLDLQSHYPASEWYWIIGLDAFQRLPRWYRRHEWVSRCSWLVAPRPLSIVPSHSDASILCQEVSRQMTDQDIWIRWYLLDMPLINISSSLIRRYCGDRRSIRYLVPDSIYTYIHTHHLYGC